MTKVPEYNIPMPKKPPVKVIYCFPPGTSQTDKQHDIKEIEKFIAHIKAKRKK